LDEDEIEEVEEIEAEELVPEDKEEAKKKHPYGLPEWVKNPDYPAIPEEVAEAIGMEVEEERRFPLDKALIKLLARRKNAMKILKWLYERNDAFYTHEIAEGMGLQDTTAHYNLKKLEQARLVSSKKFTNLDKMTKYWYVTDKKGTELVLKQYYWQISFNLGRLIPYERVREKDLKKDKRFVEKCRYYGLSIDEGAQIVKECPKIGVQHERGITFIWRKEQGYIPAKSE